MQLRTNPKDIWSFYLKSLLLRIMYLIESTMIYVEGLWYFPEGIIRSYRQIKKYWIIDMKYKKKYTSGIKCLKTYCWFQIGWISFMMRRYAREKKIHLRRDAFSLIRWMRSDEFCENTFQENFSPHVVIISDELKNIRKTSFWFYNVLTVTSRTRTEILIVIFYIRYVKDILTDEIQINYTIKIKWHW